MPLNHVLPAAIVNRRDRGRTDEGVIDVEIDVQQPVARGRRRKRRQQRIVAAVLVGLAVVLVAIIWQLRSQLVPNQRDLAANPGNTQPNDSTAAGHGNPLGAPNKSLATVPPSSPSSSVPLIPDDGETLWVSPTHGSSIDLAYLPPGCQIFLSVRPSALMAHPEGEKVHASLEPWATLAIETLERQSGIRFEAIEQATIGWRVAIEGHWISSLVVEPVDQNTIVEVRDKLRGEQTSQHEGRKFWQRDRYAYFFATLERQESANQVLVITPREDLADVVDLEGRPPALRRDMESLVAHSDRMRHITALYAPNYLRADGKNLFAGAVGRLEKPLDWLQGDGLTAVSVSLHWEDDFFMEIRAAATIDIKPHQLAKQLATRIAEIPIRIEEFMFTLDAQRYARRVLARLPEMARTAARYTRCGWQADHAVVRTYLPVAAGHNLLLAGGLALEEPMRQANTRTIPTTQSTQGANPLDQITSLTFDQETLEAALKLLAQDVGIKIHINGKDLQADGITKNQSFALNLRDRPARQILVEILRLANPDKASTGTQDPRQKLIYVLPDTTTASQQAIVITTRAAAAGRGDPIPGVFGGQ